MKFDIPHIKQFIEAQGPDTRIYIGVDSERVRGHDKQWYGIYTAAIVVHINGNNGCKLFGEVTRERDYDRVNKPNTRLMTEVYKVSELYLKLSEVLEGRAVEVHLDINPDEHHASSNVVAQAIGYIKGTCNVVPLVKPEAFAASYAADRIRGLKVVNG
jgi:predicted RNase H-related nuclease YkuK (DUF458 family)